jgi:two-component system cell cycle sensor histidine kinase/response regulator CckA
MNGRTVQAVPERVNTEEDVLRVLLVDDSSDDAEIVARELRRGGREVAVERVCDAEAMRVALARQSWDIVLSDWTMPSFSGKAALEVLNAVGVEVPFIIVSGTVTEDLAINAMRSGARDWVLKGKLARLLPAVSRELRESSERKRAVKALRRSEEQLRQSQKMDAIGGLAAGVAHDFNNVLSVIIGHADLLLFELDAADSSRESIEEIRSAAARAAELTRQLLAFSRQQILQPQKTDIARVVSGMAKMLRRLIGEDVDLSIVAPTEIGTVLVDPGQMEQVVMNLAVNARDAMPRGGKLTIETADVDIGDDQALENPNVSQGAHVMLAVTDTGTGMDAATQSRIFEPFFTTKEPGSGTGLGLATVFGIVQQSGGTIVTTSELGQGTTFRIYLPRIAPDGVIDGAPGGVRRRSKTSLRGHETLLLVEDDDAVRGTLKAVLEKYGYRVLDAPNGREALLLCETVRGPIDLVLTDVVMPHMSGREFAARLEAVRPGLPVLYMSGYTDRSIVHHGVLEAGIAFVQKPVAPHVLVEKVRELLSDRPRPLS